MRKLKEYIPAMLMTNLSTLLLVTVDGVVAGNLVGEDALASINIFSPISILVGSLSILTSSGISVSISTAMGKNDPEELDRVKGISLRVLILVAAAAAFIQIPLVWMILRSYGLSPEMFAMTMQYAAGIMLCTPLGIISSTGTYQLQIAGKMKVLMRLSVMEGIANLLFDLYFMGVLDIGVGGAGFGTACANLLRCTIGEGLGSSGADEEVWELACNIDDMTGEDMAFAGERIMSAGALDVAMLPATMKKGRPGVVMLVLCAKAAHDVVLDAVFRHTSTLGVREHLCRRHVLARHEGVATLAGGATVRVKTSEGRGVVREKLEHDDLASVARASGASLAEVRASFHGSAGR